MIDEDWRSFSSAFAQAVRPDDPRGRTGRRLLTIAVYSMLATGIAALIYGALGGSAVALGDLSPLDQEPGAAYRVAGAPPGQKWSTVAGPSCVGGTGSFAVYGYYTGTAADQTTGWTSSATGGYSGGGCTGGYLSVPVSGKPGAFDSDRFALWKFDFSSQFTNATCQVSAYVPKNPSRAFVGGNPAYYYYYGADYTYGSAAAPPRQLGGYVVDQVAKQGRWVAADSFTVSTGKVTVKLVDAGARSAGAAADAHAAAAQIRLSCTSL